MKQHIIFITALLSSLVSGQTKDSANQVKTIGTVTVNGKKALVERKVDRLVYNIQNSMLSNGSNGSEVLASTPLLKLDEDKGIVSIAGKNGVSIMVNDRMLNLSGAELMNYLRNLRSDNILKIEVITTPPAKYDAQGNSGIINIVLKKNVDLGWSGYINTYYNQRTYGGFGGSTGINYQDKKIKATVKFQGFDTAKRSVENFQIVGKESSFSRDERRDMYKGLGLNANVDYSLSDQSSVGLIYDITKGDLDMDIYSTQDYFTGNTPTLLTETDSKHRSVFTTQMLNTYFDHKFGDHKLSLGYNYYGNVPDTQVNFITTDLSDHSQETVRNLSAVDYKISSAQADLTLNFKKLQVETGAKYSQFSNNSNIEYFDLKNNNYEIDFGKTNQFEYNEKNYAAYISTSKDFGEKWSAKAGLRYEYVQTSSFSPTTQSQTENNYGKFFPTTYISYKANSRNQFSLNYSRRINRPNFNALNPFRWYSNPRSYSTGNPELQPSFNDNIEFNYIFKNKFSANVYYQRTNNNFGQILFLDQETVTSSYYNYYNQDTYGINFNYTDTFFKFWESNISTSFSYNETQVTRFNLIPKSGQSFYYSLKNTFQLNKTKTFFLFMNYWQSLPSREGNTYQKNMGSLDAGVKMNFMEKALQINLSVSDIFKQSKFLGDSYYTDNTQSFNNYWDARRLNVSVTYNFGNQKVKSNTRAVNFEEKQRAE